MLLLWVVSEPSETCTSSRQSLNGAILPGQAIVINHHTTGLTESDMSE